MTGPPTKTLDFSVFKDFNVTERWKLQFRSEAFNLFNTPIFNIPGMNVTDSKALGGNGNFGKITSTADGYGAPLAVRAPAVVLSRTGLRVWRFAIGGAALYLASPRCAFSNFAWRSRSIWAASGLPRRS